MSRRRAPRRARRLQVHFWRQGESHSFPGYTTNLSTTGMFIATNSPLPSGTRLRIEVLDLTRSFMLEGVVAHARKIRGELARVAQSGMGVRFLTVEELVRELLPIAPGQTEEIPAGPSAQAEAPVEYEEVVLPPSPPPAAPAETVPPAPPTRMAAPRPPAPPVQATPPAASPALTSPGNHSTGLGLYSVEFASVRDFLEVFRRDILNGGLFVPTRYPARIQEVVEVDLQPPELMVPPVRMKARVVQRFAPHSDDLDGTNLLSGMGLELLDLPVVIEKLRPMVARLDR
ncbi:MAG TPA: PilZ domain-containing protein [Thermoanaerobaculia bacterium]|nr:PilZ domain-containing protein [Thermoanaerobaculia bacterium]